jgi:hypothetical protein
MPAKNIWIESQFHLIFVNSIVIIDKTLIVVFRFNYIGLIFTVRTRLEKRIAEHVILALVAWHAEQLVAVPELH